MNIDDVKNESNDREISEDVINDIRDIGMMSGRISYMRINYDEYKSTIKAREDLLRCRMERIFAKWLAGEINLDKKQRFIIGFYLRISGPKGFARAVNNIACKLSVL